LIIHGDWHDLDSAALRTAHSAFGYAGQSCISVQRVFVERKIFQTFVWKLVDITEKLVSGAPSNEAPRSARSSGQAMPIESRPGLPRP